MRVLFAIKSLVNPGGGAERVFAEVVGGLHAKGEDLKILTFDQSNCRSFYNVPEEVERINIGIGDSATPAGKLNTIQRIWAIRREVLKLQPDIAVGFMHSMFVPLGIALTGTKIPVIGSEHIVREHYRNRRGEWMLVCASPFWLKQMTAVSNQARSSYPNHIKDMMSVIPNPISINVRKKADVLGEGKQKVLLAVGSLRKQKGFLTLIQAFGAIAENFPNWNLRIIGEGEERVPLEQSISGLGLNSRVMLPGATSNVQLEYENAHLFVNSSHYESQGLTTIEAIAHGLPAVGFKDCPGTNEIISDGINGILVPSDRDKASKLAEGLGRLMSCGELRSTMSGVGFNNYPLPSKEAVTEHWLDLFGRYANN